VASSGHSYRHLDESGPISEWRSKLLALKNLLERRKAVETQDKEIRRLCNHYSRLVEIDAWDFDALPDSLRAGVVRNTIFTPDDFWDLGRVVRLSVLGYACEYLVNYPWLSHHPLLAIRVTDLPLFPAGPRYHIDVSSQIAEFLRSLDGGFNQRDFEGLLSGDVTFGSAVFVVVDEIAYSPLLPSSIVAATNGRMASWGSLAFTGAV
jgi:hypothetical protein